MSDVIVLYTSHVARPRAVDAGVPGPQPHGKGADDRSPEHHRDRGVCHLRYLADAFPDAGLAPPPGDPPRGTHYRWMFFAAGHVEAAVSNKSLGFDVPQERRGMVGYGSIDQVTNGQELAISRERRTAVRAGTTNG